MRAEVQFGEELLGFDLDDERILGVWQGPADAPAVEVGQMVLDALENPAGGYPALRQIVVPGDQVVIAWDDEIPCASDVLQGICAILNSSGVEPESIHVLASSLPTGGWDGLLPAGVIGSVHDPGEAAQLAYLATTAHGRRVYLNRRLTDADCVVPVGRLGYDPSLGYRGPWGTILPGLSDAETLRAFRSQESDDQSNSTHDRPLLTESVEASWLLGSQFQIGILPGRSGLAGVFAGLDATVRADGARQLDAAWTFRADQQAELVIAGIGTPGRPTRLDDLALGLATASRLVRHGGKIVALSRAGGPLGEAFQRLNGSDDPHDRRAALADAKDAPDFAAARRLIAALSRADVYLLSSLTDDQADDLGMIPLGRPEEARRLAVTADSCLLVSHANRTRVELTDEDD
ncbi:MAG: lactate racemase domain-containing protein [Isosphaeraceae bacterium]